MDPFEVSRHTICWFQYEESLPSPKANGEQNGFTNAKIIFR